MNYFTHMFAEQDTLSLFRTKSPRYINRLEEVEQVVSTWHHNRTWARLGHGHTRSPLLEFVVRGNIYMAFKV